MVNVLIRSREVADYIASEQDPKISALISIYSTGDGPIHSRSYPFLGIRFDDMTPDHLYSGMHLFTEDQAKEIVQFVEKNKDRTNWLVHCDAGVSRSGAVGTWIYEKLNNLRGLPVEQVRLYNGNFRLENPQIQPNPYILRLMRKVGG